MAKTFTAFVTRIPASWLNPVSVLVEDVFLQATNAPEARDAIFACENSPLDSTYYVRQTRSWVDLVSALADLNCCFPEAPEDGLSYARQNTGTPDSYGNPNQWTRTQRVYVQETDPAV